MSDVYFKNKTIVVTGCAGFVGSHLAEALLDQGAIVLGVDNFITGDEGNFKTFEDNSNFHFFEANCSDVDYLELFDGFSVDGIFHFASPASPPFYQKYPVETYMVNSYATHRLLQFLKEHYPKARFLFASTSEVYGDPQIHPQSESYWGNVNPNGIRSCYDESKRLGESICGVFQRDYTIDVRIVRIFNTYGPRIGRHDGRIIPNFITQALAGEDVTIYGDGLQTRSYCYVADLVDGLLLFMSSDNAKGETINLGNPDEYTVKETAEKILNLTQSQSKLSFQDLPKDDPTRRKPDIAKAREILGWEPRVSFADGLKRTIEFFKDS